jgi:hypothetical protein
MFDFFKFRRRRKLLAQPLPDPWRQIIERNVAVYSQLSEPEQRRLVGAARIIVAERRFEGCKGLVVTEEMRVTIAAQAALLLLGEDGYFFDRVEAFLIYPYVVVVRPSGFRTEEEDELDRVAQGVAEHEGQIVLSWPDALAGGRDAGDAQNVVLHELAHHLDGLDGEMGGSPPVATAAERTHWHNVLSRELDALRQDLADGRPTLLHPPAAENTTEVFAYGTECFFEKPLELAAAHPDLFDCFRSFYKVDPRPWFERAGRGAQPTPADHRPAAPVRKAERREPGKRPPRHLPALDNADQYFTRGLEFLQRGRFEQAEADFNQAVRLAPDDQEALTYRAESRLWLNHVEAALADADRACRMDPSDLHARRIRGLCRVALGDFRPALNDLVGTVEADDAEAHFCRGLAHARLGQPREALADLSRAIELQPDDAEAYLERADCYERLGDDRAAHADRQRARELDPGGDGDGD